MDYTVINEFLKFKCRDIESYVFQMSLKDILPSYYVAVRGRDKIDGAVQRPLNPRRISAIADFVRKGNMFLNPFILNWTNNEFDISERDSQLKIPIISSSMQVIDGQHRLEGLKKAYEEDVNIGEGKILIILTSRLPTTLAAEVFLNINYEQKQVPKSLAYDLFGEIRDPDYNINRARELAERMNSDSESPYYQCIKMPSGLGKIDLSTVVASLKDYLKDKEVFDRYGLTAFESQYKIIKNFHLVIKAAYDKTWLQSSNPFITGAGFFASIVFLCKDLIPVCVREGSFEIKTIEKLLPFDKDDLFDKSDLSNIQGKEQRSKIYEHLREVFLKDTIPGEFKF